MLVDIQLGNGSTKLESTYRRDKRSMKCDSVIYPATDHYRLIYLPHKSSDIFYGHLLMCKQSLWDRVPLEMLEQLIKSG